MENKGLDMKPNSATSLVEHHPGLNRRLSIQSIESSISDNSSGDNSPRGSSSSTPASPLRRVVPAPMLSALWVSKSPTFENLEGFSVPTPRAGVISRSQHLSPSFENLGGLNIPTTPVGVVSRAQLRTVWRAKSMPSLEQEESPQMSLVSSPVHKSGSNTSSPRSSRRSSFSSRRSFSMETEHLSHDLSVSDPDSPSRSTSHISANHRTLMARRQRSKSCVSQFMPSVKELKGLFDKDTNENNIPEDTIINDTLANLNIEIEETNPIPTQEAEKPKSKKKERRVSRHQSLIKWEPRLSEDHLVTKTNADIQKLQFSPVKSMLLQFEKKPTPKKALNLNETKIVEIVENNNSTIDIKGRSRASIDPVAYHYENKENEAPIISESNKTTENIQPNISHRNENNSGLSSVRKLRLQWEKTVKEKNSSPLHTQRPASPHKSPTSPQKSPTSPQKSPASPQKSPASPQKIQINKNSSNLNEQISIDQFLKEEVIEIEYKEEEYNSLKENDLTNNNQIKEDYSETDHKLNEHILSVYTNNENITSQHISIEAKSVEPSAAGHKSTEQLPNDVLSIPSVRNLRQQFEAVASTPSYNKTEGLDEQPHQAAVSINEKVIELEKCGKQSGEEDQRMSGSKIVRVPSTSIKSLRLQFERTSSSKENTSQESSRTSSPFKSPASSPTSPTSPSSPLATSPRSPLSTSNILARSMTDSGTSMTMEISSSSADIFSYNENFNLKFSDHDLQNNNILLQEDLREHFNENNNDVELHEKNQAVNEYWKQQENEKRKKEEEKQIELKKFKEMRRQKKIDEDQENNLRRKRVEKQQEFLNKVEINDKKNRRQDLEKDNNQINTKNISHRDINTLRNKFENKNIKSEENRLDNDNHSQHNSEVNLRREKSKNLSEKSRKLNPDELSFFKDFSTTGNHKTVSDSMKTTDEHTSVSENNRLSYMSVDEDVDVEEESKKIDKYSQEREQFLKKDDRQKEIDLYLSQKHNIRESEPTNLSDDAENTDNRIVSMPSLHMGENNNFSNNEDLHTIEETSDDETSESISQNHPEKRKLSYSKYSDCDRTNGNIETHAIIDQNINENNEIYHNDDEKIKVDERKAELQKFKELRESMRKKKQKEKESENEQKGVLEDAKSSLEKDKAHLEKDIEQEHSNTNSPRTSPSKSLTRSPSKSSSKSSSRSSSRSGSQISLPGNCRPLNSDEMKFFMGTPSNEPFLRTQSLRVHSSKSKAEGSSLSILKEKKRRSSSFAERSTSNLNMSTATQRNPRIEAPPPPKNLPQGCRQLRPDELKFFFGGSTTLSTNINIYSSKTSVAEEEEDFISEA